MFNLESIVFVVYLAFMLGIGVYFFVKSKDGGEKDYFLGGRQMGPWVSALSAGASDMSANQIINDYAMFERAIMYDWCLADGEYAIAQYGDRMMPMFVKCFLPQNN